MRIKDLTPEWLIKEHFFGIYAVDSQGEVYLPNPRDPSEGIERSVLQGAISAAIARIESHLDLTINLQEQVTEFHDYDVDTYSDFTQINLRKYPLAKVHSLQIVYGEHGQTIWDVPADMIQTHGTKSKFGMLNILPMFGLGQSYSPMMAPTIFPSLLPTSHAPSLIKVVYDAGLDGWDHGDGSPKSLPADLVRAISLLAAMHPFNILGDLVIGAGISSVSWGVDGVSQSINTTASAENSAYSSRIIMHRRELYGEQGTPGILQNLEKQWRRYGLGLL